MSCSAKVCRMCVRCEERACKQGSRGTIVGTRRQLVYQLLPLADDWLLHHIRNQDDVGSGSEAVLILLIFPVAFALLIALVLLEVKGVGCLFCYLCVLLFI